MSAGPSLVALDENAWERLKNLRLVALEQDPGAFGSTLERELALPEARWRQRLSGARSRTLVATRDGADVGLVMGWPWEGESAVSGLFGLWVAPSARGAGVGGELTKGIVDWARRCSFERMRLHVWEANESALALYVAHGFVDTGRTWSPPPPREHLVKRELELELDPDGQTSS